MTTETVLTNGRVVTRDADFDGTLVLRDGAIAEVDSARSSLPGAVDVEGDFLLPGLVEMHTDNLEGHMEPRPGTIWPSAIAAVVGHDVQVAGAGITTVLDAVAVGEYVKEKNRNQIIDDSVAAVGHAREEGLLRADHLLHMRAEIAGEGVVDRLRPYLDNPLVRLVSVMDHTPGQRQWTDPEHYFTYYKDKYGRAELEALLEKKIAEQKKYAALHRTEIVSLCKQRGLPLASHDDATEAHVRESVEDGMVIAEFPITLTAAETARRHGMGTVMGAPNVVRGGSHSGNLSALDAAREGHLDGLSSDYVPASLLFAAFILHEKLAMPLPEAVAKASDNIARMLGLDDRGRLEPGLRADVIRVHLTDHTPIVVRTWRQGRVVA